MFSVLIVTTRHQSQENFHFVSAKLFANVLRKQFLETLAATSLVDLWNILTFIYAFIYADIYVNNYGRKISE